MRNCCYGKGGPVGPPFFVLCDGNQHTIRRPGERRHRSTLRANGAALCADPLARNDEYPYLRGLTGAEICSVRSRSVMSMTVTMGAVSS
jgi:hypothetical protein